MLRALTLGAALWMVMGCQHQKSPHPHAAHTAQHRFDDPKDWAERFDDPSRDEWQKPDEVIAALKIPANGQVADLGSATGYFTIRLAKAQPDAVVYGADVEAQMTTYLTERAQKERLANVRALTVAADKLALPEPVDVLLLVNTYHHLSNRPAYFTEVAKTSLRPGGRVAVVDFKKGIELGPPDEEKLAPEEVVAELKQAGFTLTESFEFLPHQYFLVFSRSG